MIRLNNIFSFLAPQPSLKFITTSLLILTGCNQTPPPQPPTAVSYPTPPSPQPSPYTTQATLLAVGDVMMHKA